jgi:hypothetical protein
VPAIVAALFLVAHGLIHASFVSPAPPATTGGPQWPFDLTRSWALSPLGLDAAVTRVVGLALVTVVVAGYAAAASSYVGVTPGAWFAPAVVAASLASLALLGLFFHPWLVLGLAIDALLLWAVLLNGWSPKGAL